MDSSKKVLQYAQKLLKCAPMDLYFKKHGLYIISIMLAYQINNSKKNIEIYLDLYVHIVNSMLEKRN